MSKQLPNDVLELAFRHRRKHYAFSQWPILHQKLLDAEQLYLDYIRFLDNNKSAIERLPDETRNMLILQFHLLKLNYSARWLEYNGQEALNELINFYKKDMFSWLNFSTPTLVQL